MKRIILQKSRGGKVKKKVINIFKNENKIALIGIVMIVIFTVSFFVSYQYEWKML